ncbi:lipoprotein [Rhodoferax sp. U2-2l]|uniref:LPS translocon maturation chaperone LptM n=1 Tax=Rhodoferax sp. U2-2l TaxID=2884000 RepID=UPI001D0A2DC5|nr:lipoprotein [Rhodoferax sp. U2-2l]MCB8745796.1 lipoprotein [Rhodoferax sp. U2-2l]
MLFKKNRARPLALAAVAVTLAACGQTGPLYLPTPPAGVHRATLPESLMPGSLRTTAPGAQATPAPAQAASQPPAAR